MIEVYATEGCCRSPHRQRVTSTPKFSAPPEPAQCHNVTPATQSAGRCREVRRLPHRMEVDASKRHACHTNSRGVHGAKQEPSAPPEPAKSHKCHRRPHKMKVDVAKCHACHTNSRGVHGAKQEPSAPPEPAKSHKCHRRPHKVKVDVAKSHACHTNSRSVYGDKREPSAPPEPPSATPATQNWSRCFHMPRLPHKQPRRPRRQTGTERATRATPKPEVPAKCHACHTELKVYGGVAKRCACHANSRGVQGDKREPSAKAQVDAAKRQGGEGIVCV